MSTQRKYVKISRRNRIFIVDGFCLSVGQFVLKESHVLQCRGAAEFRPGVRSVCGNWNVLPRCKWLATKYRDIFLGNQLGITVQ